MKSEYSTNSFKPDIDYAKIILDNWSVTKDKYNPQIELVISKLLQQYFSGD